MLLVALCKYRKFRCNSFDLLFIYYLAASKPYNTIFMRRAVYHLFTLFFLLLLLAGSCDTKHSRVEENDNNQTENNPDNNGDDNTPSEDYPEAKDGEFVILFTNDFHSQIEPLSEDETYNADRGGAKRIKALVDSVRMAEPAVLLADAGDFVQGTYYFSLLDGVVEMMILDELGYDVRTLGNHEFDKKMSGLENMLRWSDVPVVATNYDFTSTSLANSVEKSIILDAGKVKVGFIGLNIRLQSLVDPTAYEGVGWQNAINVADAEAARLREQGADMVIALSHLGYEKGNDIYYYDRGVAKGTRHIDMIIGGHTHTFLNSADYVTNLDGDRVPIVQTGSKGICLGYAKIKLDEQGKPSFTYKLLPVKKHLDSKLDAEFSAMIDAFTTDVNEEMNQVLGYCPTAIRKGLPESPLGNLSADGLVWMAKQEFDVDIDVAIYNSAGIRAEISKGDLCVKDVYAVYPFDNRLSVLTLKGSDLRGLFDQVASGGGLPINEGVKLVIKDKKVKSLTIKGEPIVDSRIYNVATIDYVVNTKGYNLNKATSRRDAGEMIYDGFVEYFRYLASQNSRGEITSRTEGRIVIE